MAFEIIVHALTRYFAFCILRTEEYNLATYLSLDYKESCCKPHYFAHLETKIPQKKYCKQ
jgi:hypothetical protein